MKFLIKFAVVTSCLLSVQAQARFTQADTWQGIKSQPITLNKYTYANLDPVNTIDPTGHFGISSFGTSSSISGTLSTTAVSSGARFAVGRAIGATFTASRQVSARLRQELKICRVTKGRKCRLPNFVVNGNDYPESQQHISDAQQGRGSNRGLATPIVTYSGNKKRTRWYAKKPECFGKATRKLGTDCDEYPFQSTREGGPNGYARGQVSLRPIASCCNQGFGGVWGRAIQRGKLRAGEKVLIVPYGPTSFYMVNGQFGL